MWQITPNNAPQPTCEAAVNISRSTVPEISTVSPFFIVHDGAAALSFYRDQLGAIQPGLPI